MHKISFFIISSLYASTCFEHYLLIIRRSKLYYTASDIITPIGGCPVHRLRDSTLDVLLIIWKQEGWCVDLLEKSHSVVNVTISMSAFKYM